MENTQDIYPEIPIHKAMRLMGIRKENTLSKKTHGKLKKYIKVTHETMTPQLVHTAKEIKEINQGGVLIDEHISFMSTHLADALQGSEELIFFIVTIGDAIDGKIRGLMDRGKIADAYILDAIGSAAVEEAAENFQREYGAKLSSAGKGTTLRFSPGYCDWDIKEQKKIFSILDAEQASVTLNSKYKMEPSKSVSGAFGITQKENTSNGPVNPCKSCGLKSCMARR
ncbi:MAG: vitamin B12 dependent-methionine synthase activation domain-containing protein [Thermodesulfobacteriota bacterium]|nr:vitamin B12 dependent-methionine synthase activation domain-containing protein [Thermodesulfobacteriota bacterium]